MANHFACIGFDFVDGRAFGETVRELARGVTREQGALGTRLQWSDASGATLSIFLDGNSHIACVKPGFAGSGRTLTQPERTLDDPLGCAFCAMAHVWVLEDGAQLYPLAIELEDAHLGPLDVSPGTTVPLGVTAFAESFGVWTDAEAYDADSTDGSLRFATRSVIPSGLFTPQGKSRARSEAIFTGEVVRSAVLVNSRTGNSFQAAQVATLGGTFDVVIAPDEPALTSGNVVQGTFWLVARPERGPRD